MKRSTKRATKQRRMTWRRKNAQKVASPSLKVSRLALMYGNARPYQRADPDQVLETNCPCVVIRADGFDDTEMVVFGATS